MTTTEIRASLSDKLIRNADRYFTADLGQMIDEIVQNARRAGARTLRARLADGVLTLADDGRGLTAADAPVLLQLGGSSNTDAIETAENAAGVGFFSMAHADVTVRSHDWEMRVPRDAFTGRASASLTSGLPHQDGLTLTLTGLADKPGYANLAGGSTLIGATRYSGLRLVLEGFGGTDGVHEPRSFLADETPEAAQSLVAEAHGLTIKLVRRTGGRAKSPVRINFFGKVIGVPTSDWTKGFIDETVGVMSTGRSYETVLREDYTIDVLVDVHDTSVLRLQLPERNAPIYDAGYARVGETVQALYRDLLAGLPGPNGVPMEATVRKDLGLRLAPPQIVVHGGLEGRYDDPSILGISTPEGILGPNGKLHPLETCVALPGSGFLPPLIRSERARSAFDSVTFVKFGDVHKAYGPDAIASVEGTAIVVKLDGEEHRLEIEDQDLGAVYDAIEAAEIPAADRLIDDAALILTVRGREIVAPIPAVVFAQWDDNDQAGVFIVRGQESHTVVSLMLASIGWWNEESDYQSGESEAAKSYRTWVANVLGTGEELLRERVAQAVRYEAYDFAGAIPEGEGIAFTVRITRENGILVVAADRALPKAA